MYVNRDIDDLMFTQYLNLNVYEEAIFQGFPKKEHSVRSSQMFQCLNKQIPIQQIFEAS